jgi:signal transduction histidine kinase
VVGRHENECRSRHIELTYSIAPGAETPFGDAFRLEQALANIIANALRHSHDSGRIELRAERSDRHIVFVVADNGEGIAREHLPLIFDRFYKAGRRKGENAGSGLGLYIVKTIVARHGGEVTAFSEVGRGTRIRIELPIPADDRTSGELTGAAAQPPGNLGVRVRTSP